jgi:DNA-binding CsgD family transcriptional regulator
MKRVAARAYIQQLCCLGRGGLTIVPELLRELAKVIPAGPSVFTGVTPDFEPAYAIVEGVPLHLLERAAPEIHGAFQHVADAHRDWWRRHPGRVISSCTLAVHGDFDRSVFYRHIWRPLKQHHFLEGLVRECDRPLGMIHLFRPKNDRPFNQYDAAELAHLLPHIAHGVTAFPGQDDIFVDSERHGYAIVDGSGRITHRSEAARKLLSLAGHALADVSCHAGDLSFAPLFRKLAADACAIAVCREARPPVARRQNGWGRFVFRAYRLDAAGHPMSGFALIAIEYHEPLRLRLLRGLRSFPLSAKEREVCFWVARGFSQTEIAQFLHVKPGTAKKYVDAVYLKLGIHNRYDLVLRILSEREQTWIWDAYDFVPFIR